MTANPVELIGGLTTNANVPKADIVGWAKARVPQLFADFAEARNTTLAGQLVVTFKSTGGFWYQDTTDTTTADDGVSCIVSLDGKRFKPLSTGAFKNTRLAKTANYTVANVDKFSTIALGGSACFSLTFNAASGYDADFGVFVLNEDSGRGKIIALNGLAPFILWPLQSIIVFSQNNVWQTMGKARWKPPASSTLNFYTDFTNGTDTIGATDGLAAGSAAFKTVERAFVNAADRIDLNTESQTLIIVNLADNITDTQGLHGPVHALTGAQGGAAFKIKGGTNSIISVTGADGISAYFGTVLYLQNLTLRSNINGLNALWGSKVYLDNVTFGGGGVVPLGGHITIQGSAQIEQVGAVSIAGNAAYCINNDSGHYRTAGQSFAFSADAAFSGAFLLAIGPSKTSFAGTTISLNAHTITGKRFAVSNGSYVGTGTGLGSLTYFPGSVAGTVSDGGTYDTVMNTTVAQGGTGVQVASGTALDNITGFASTGLLIRTASATYAFRTLTGPAAGISVSNGDGVSGNPTLALANDLAALEALASNGYARRTGTDTWQIDAAGQIIGTATNDNAAAGFVGESISSAIAAGSAVALTSGTPANVTSISLTAGDWDVFGAIEFKGGATTTINYVQGGPSDTSATMQEPYLFSLYQGGVTPFGTITYISFPFPTRRISVASTTTIYLVANAGFGVSTCSAYGRIEARRRR